MLDVPCTESHDWFAIQAPLVCTSTRGISHPGQCGHDLDLDADRERVIVLAVACCKHYNWCPSVLTTTTYAVIIIINVIFVVIGHHQQQGLPAQRARLT